MKRYEFSSHGRYVRAQRRVTLSKIKRPAIRVFTSQKAVDAIHKYCQDRLFFVQHGMCHGVRKGEELDLFDAVFPTAHWIGTEIVEELCDDERVINANFSDDRDEWIGKFDLIYTNSFDHARYPQETLKTWMSQLRPGGHLFVEWTPWHAKLGKRWNRADCFAATRAEYKKLFDDVGGVTEIEVVEKRFTRVIFAVQNDELDQGQDSEVAG